MSKTEKIRDIINHFSGANIVVYAPNTRYNHFRKVIDPNAVCVEDLFSKSPFLEKRTVFINSLSVGFASFNWTDVTVFVDISEDEENTKSDLYNLIVHCKIYYKLKYIINYDVKLL